MSPKSTALKAVRLHLNEPRARPTESAEVYPDTSTLQAVLAKHLGVREDEVLVTAGGDQALDAACRAANEGSAVILNPDFPRYAHHSANAGHVVVRVQIGDYPFTFPADDLLATLMPETTLAIVSTVGNPTGIRPPRGLIEEMRRRAPNALLVVDEVYSPFTGDNHIPFATATPNVVSVRSFSKIGFPGLRLGYAVGRADTLRTLSPFVSPFSVATSSVERAVEIIRLPASWSDTIERQIAAREWLAARLTERGIRVSSSSGNWLLAYFGDMANDVSATLKADGVLVQQQVAPELEGWIRISTPDIDDLGLLLEELEAVTVRR